MRVLKRNEIPFYYATYQGIADYEVGGYKNGEKTISYSAPTLMRASISANRGTNEVDQFGTNLQYDKVIITGDMNCPIDENTILWVDKEPYNNNTLLPHNYIVKKIAKSLNYISIAIKRVEQS